MSLQHGAVTTRRVVPAPIVPHLAALAIVCVVWAALFWPEITAAVGVWYESTAYSHCFMVLPIAIYLAWDRREMLSGVPIRPALWAAPAAIPLMIGWFAAERLGIMEVRQFAALGLLMLAVFVVLGWRMTRALAAPLLYLVFLVPFGAFITPVLQNITLSLTMFFLGVAGVPAVSDGYTIEVPHATFFVAEACAGLRFLIASIAFGTLYACLIYRSASRRGLFILASVIIPIVANGLRAFGIVFLGYMIGSAEAAAADHLIYGWVFFSFVIVLLILAGLPFRQDRIGASAPIVAGPVLGRAPWAPAALVLLLGAAGPAAAAMLDRAAFAHFAPALPRLDAAGCRAAPNPEPGLPGGVGTLTQLDCGPAGAFTLLVEVFPARSNPAAMQAALHGAGHEADAFDVTSSSLTVPGGTPRNWRLVETSEPARLTASSVWIDGRPAPGGLAGRLEQARDSLFGAARAPVLVALSQAADPPRLAPADLEARKAAMADILSRQAGWPAAINAIASTAAQ